MIHISPTYLNIYAIFSWFKYVIQKINHFIGYLEFTENRPTICCVLKNANLRFLHIVNLYTRKIFLCLVISSFRTYYKHNLYSKSFSLIIISFFLVHDIISKRLRKSSPSHGTTEVI